MPQAAQNRLAQILASGVQPAWQAKNAWTVLDASGGYFCQNFLQIWQCWKSDLQRPRLLHYAGLARSAADVQAQLAKLPTEISQSPLCLQFRETAWGLLEGIQRLSFESGNLNLTFFIGERPEFLDSIQCRADAVLLLSDASSETLMHQPLDVWQLKALAKCCSRGSRLFANEQSGLEQVDFEKNGFRLEKSDAEGLNFCFDPPWQTRQTRTLPLSWQGKPGKCCVIGAGLAGASLARAMAIRDWQVLVVDSNVAPAQGASGLPAGLVVPNVSPDDSPRSQLSRTGIRLMKSHADELLEAGQDFEFCGVLENFSLSNKSVPEGASLAWSEQESPAAGSNSVWHPIAGWVKPAALVRAWLKHQSIQFLPGTKVEKLSRNKEKDNWEILDADCQKIAESDLVLVANATNAARLILALDDSEQAIPELVTKLHLLQTMHGSVSMGDASDLHGSGIPNHPHNGSGSFIPAVPSASDQSFWIAGGTFHTDWPSTQDVDSEHAANFAKSVKLIAKLQDIFKSGWKQESTRIWSSARCISHDRMPLCGPVLQGAHPTLWMSAAMGTRGLAFAVLCAELLAARLHDEPWPVKRSQVKLLDTSRPVKRG